MSYWFAFAAAFLSDSVPKGLKAYGQEELKKRSIIRYFYQIFFTIKGFRLSALIFLE